MSGHSHSLQSLSISLLSHNITIKCFIVIQLCGLKMSFYVIKNFILLPSELREQNIKGSIVSQEKKGHGLKKNEHFPTMKYNIDFQTQLTFHFSQIVTKQLFKFSTFHVLFLLSIQTSKWQQSRMSWQLKTVSNPNK